MLLACQLRAKDYIYAYWPNIKENSYRTSSAPKAAFGAILRKFAARHYLSLNDCERTFDYSISVSSISYKIYAASR